MRTSSHGRPLHRRTARRCTGQMTHIYRRCHASFHQTIYCEHDWFSWTETKKNQWVTGGFVLVACICNLPFLLLLDCWDFCRGGTLKRAFCTFSWYLDASTLWEYPKARTGFYHTAYGMMQNERKRVNRICIIFTTDDAHRPQVRLLLGYFFVAFQGLKVALLLD